MTLTRAPRSMFVGVALLSAVLGGFGAMKATAAGPARHAGLHLVSPGYLTVGSDTTYPPMESVDPHNPNHYVGADIDLAAALAGAMHLKGARIVNNSFDTIIPALQRRKFDVVMSSMSDTPARAKVISFVDYMRGEAAILVRKSSSIRADSYGQMCHRTVAVERGTTELDGLNAANKSTCHGSINVKTFTADTDAYEAFASGHAEAYTGDLPVVAYYVKQHPSAYRMAGKGFSAGGPYGIGMLKSATGLRAAVQKALRTIVREGLYRRILNRWGVGDASLF